MQEEVTIPTPDAELAGILDVPEYASGIVVFAHGSGSSRLSPRNRAVAAALSSAGLATLLFDLLTETEALDRDNVFDIGLLGTRLADATDWVASHVRQPIGFFGASTGAAAAIAAAADRQASVAAIVSRGGRPDLAGAALGVVRAPTLLVVGGADSYVLELNRHAMALMTSARVELQIIPGAGHLFEEPGALEAVADLARAWFLANLVG